MSQRSSHINFAFKHMHEARETWQVYEVDAWMKLKTLAQKHS